MIKLLPAILLALAACTPPPPPFLPQKHYTDDTGLVGVTVPEGTLAGRWALLINWATVLVIPLVGERNGGAQGLRLLTRTWNPDTHRYAESFTWCRDEVFEVEGTTSNFDDAQMERLRPTLYDSDADHTMGHYQSSAVINNWGVQNLPDAYNTPLPTKDNYTTPPNSDYVLDEDNDGHPGVTAHMRGSINAEAYVCARSIYTLDGAILSADHVQGLARAQRSEQHTVDGTNRFVVGENNTHPDPDPTQSWFDAIRLPDTATCDDVRAAFSDGRLARSRPFPK